jgi:formylglycine-generating enzyme required for sulfatase activity
MRRWFLSYHSPDQALAERLKAALERKDADIQVFFAPSSLRAGGFWSRTLAEEIAQADVFILLVGDKGVGDWQELEYDEALEKRVKFPDFPVILMLLEGQTAPGLAFLRRLHWIITPDPLSETSVARLLEAASGGGSRPGELWRYTQPYRGLAAMAEKDSDYFFGRAEKTAEILTALTVAPDELLILLGNSGVGKSSLAQAGVLAALKRQTWPEGLTQVPEWPYALRDSRRWCFLTLKPGTAPLKSLVEAFLDTWQLGATDPERVRQQNDWIELLRNGDGTLLDLLDATERRYKELDRTKPPAFLLYVDQGEELYVRAEEHQRRRFSEVSAEGVADPRLYMLMSMRADFLGELQKDEALYKVRRQIDVPPLREAELRQVVSRPAELLSARFETAGLVDIITRRTVDDSVKDVGALPLLSYTLDDMWTSMVKRADGVLRLAAQSFELGGVLVDRASAFLAANPKSADELRRIFTLKLATVREGEEPTRRRALRSEFSDEQWHLVSELADHPYRLVATATPEGGETYAEVAHEAVFRRWDKLRDWIAAEREFLAWKTGLEAVRRSWQATAESARNDALLMGAALTQAQSWLAKRKEDLPVIDQNFINESSRRETRARGRVRRGRALVYMLLVGIIIGLIGWINQSQLAEQIRYLGMRPYMLAQVRPYILTAAAERVLKPGDSFRECAKDCPEMIVMPLGEAMIGSPADEKGRYGTEGPQHKVVFAKPFAVSKFEVTFDELDACVSVGGCVRANDFGLRQSRNPAIFVSWNDAQQYVAWLSKMTGQTYRLLSEAEWEYAARGGATTAYSWGDEIGNGRANCDGCGSQWDAKRPAPVGSFAANQFGLYDMHGNVWEWVEDCYASDYTAAHIDGSPWISGDCTQRVIRGGSWINVPRLVRAASRSSNARDFRDYDLGFRVGRTLSKGTPITAAPGAK